jgi:hypothetical protein
LPEAQPYWSAKMTQSGNRAAEATFVEALRNEGWSLRRSEGPGHVPGFVIERGHVSYAVEIKFAAEGRTDRLVPLWSQALLQVSRAPGELRLCLAVVVAPRIAERSARKVLEFASEYAPHAGVGVMDLTGFRRFRGAHLEGLDSDPAAAQRILPTVRRRPANLFSDLNQWMLKVLLAPEVPAELLAAPRERYANATGVAAAAGVSVMTAFRFVEQLRAEGYLDDSRGRLYVVRRENLFDRWRSAAARRAKEAPMRLLLGGEPLEQAARALHEQRACVGMFAAAEALGFGFVRGVPPYVYTGRLEEALAALDERWVPTERGEAPDLILRQPAAVKSVFRGVVPVRGLPVTDIIQTWLDVSTHPTRGAEQADLIRKRVLNRVLEGACHGG